MGRAVWTKTAINPTTYTRQSINPTAWNAIVATGALLLSGGGFLELSDGNFLGIS